MRHILELFDQSGWKYLAAKKLVLLQHLLLFTIDNSMLFS